MEEMVSSIGHVANNAQELSTAVYLHIGIH